LKNKLVETVSLQQKKKELIKLIKNNLRKRFNKSEKIKKIGKEKG